MCSMCDVGRITSKPHSVGGLQNSESGLENSAGGTHHRAGGVAETFARHLHILSIIVENSMFDRIEMNIAILLSIESAGTILN
jgi:hypothetical protein